MSLSNLTLSQKILTSQPGDNLGLTFLAHQLQAKSCSF